MNRIISVIFMCLLGSCHYYDDRLKVRNESNETVEVAVSYVEVENRNDIISPFFSIKPNEKKILYLFKNLDFDSLNLDIDSIALIVLNVKDVESIKWENGYYEYEKLLQEGSFKYYPYSIDDILKGSCKIPR